MAQDITIAEMMDMQRRLLEKYKDKWSPHAPLYARNSLLWMVDELGEAIAIIKKRGDGEIMDNAEVRRHYIEECCDVLMYFCDMCLCYGIAPGDIAEAYTAKFRYNMKRDWEKQNSELFAKGDDA